MSNSTDENEIISAISSPLELSDEEIASMSFEEVMAKYSHVTEDEDEEENNNNDSTETDPKDDVEEESDNTDDSEEDSKEEEDNTEESEEDTDLDNKENSNQNEEYTKLKEITDKIFSEFKANGKMIKVDNVEQAISLMQMGANYTQKMTQIKPKLKTLQMLEAHGIQDESQLSFLIDLHKKDPAAIAKLIKDADLSPHQLDESEAENYTGSNYSITDAQFEFKSITEELRSDTTLKYNELMQTVGTFDNRSKTAILDNPHILKELSEHFKDGIYASVMAEVDRRKILGDSRLSSMSVLDAYVTVGQELASKKAVEQPKAKTEVVATKVITPKTTPNPSKKVASKITGSGQGKATEEINFLAMTDEEFEAYSKSQRVLR